MGENDEGVERTGEAPIRRSFMGEGWQRPPTEVGAARFPVVAPTGPVPTTVPASGSPPVPRRTWIAYAGGAFIVVVGIVLGAGALLRGGAPEPSTSPTVDATASSGASPEPTWDPAPLAGVDLPPQRVPGHMDEPPAYQMEARIWDYVGPGWVLGVNRNSFEVNPQDGNAFQALYLISPEGVPFFLYKLRTDYWLGISHWDPKERMAWVGRYDSGDSWQTVELDLVTGKATEAWVVESGTARVASNVNYLATLDDGTAVFDTVNYQGGPERFITRPPGGPTTMLDAFASRESLDSTRRFVQYWIDPAAERAYYRVDTTTSLDWSTVSYAWYTHDLATDTLTKTATPPQQPTERGRCWSANVLVNHDLLVDCVELEGADFWLIDPTGTASARAYSGTVPPRPVKSTLTDPASLGLDASEGWTDLLRALP